MQESGHNMSPAPYDIQRGSWFLSCENMSAIVI